MAPSKGLDYLLIFLQVLPAVVISAGINFAVAYAMYHSQRRIYFWPFPNTIAGDLAVTNFIQGVLNYLVPCATLELDARLGKHLPWRTLWTPSLSLVSRLSSLNGYPLFIWKTFFESEDLLAPPLKPKILFKRLARTVLRALFLSVFLFLTTWSIAVAICAPLYAGRNIPGTWIPQGIKCIYGGVHALVEIPLASLLILLSIDVRRHRGEGMEDKLRPLPASTNSNSTLSAHSATPSSTIGGQPRTESAHVGAVVDSTTGRPVEIDTRTNEPLDPAQRV